MTSLSWEFLKFFIFLVASILLDICGGENITSTNSMQDIENFKNETATNENQNTTNNNTISQDIENFNNETGTNENQNTTNNTTTQDIENLNNETHTHKNQTVIKGNETWIKSYNESFECIPRRKRSSQGDVLVMQKSINIQFLNL